MNVQLHLLLSKKKASLLSSLLSLEAVFHTDYETDYSYYSSSSYLIKPHGWRRLTLARSKCNLTTMLEKGLLNGDYWMRYPTGSGGLSLVINERPCRNLKLL